MIGKIATILPLITTVLFLYSFHKKTGVQSLLLFVLYMFPLMDLKIVPEAMGGFKVFDFITIYGLVFMLSSFIKLGKRGVNVYFLLFTILFYITVLGSLSSEFNNNIPLKILRLLPMFIHGRFLLLELFNDPLFYKKVIRALKTAYIISLIFFAVQYVVGVGFSLYPSGLSSNAAGLAGAVIRYPGIFYDSQIHGQFLAMGSFLFLYFEKDASKKQRLFHYLIFALSVPAILIAGSRSAFGGFAAGFLIILMLGGKQYRPYLLSLSIIAIIAFNLVSINSGVLSRAGDVSEDYLFRRSIWQSAYKIALNHPLLGIGIGNYQPYVSIHAQDQYLDNGEISLFLDQPENGYLKILVEFGFIGFGIFCCFALLPLANAIRSILQTHSDKRITLLISVLISWLVAFNSVYSLFDNRILIMVVTCLTLLIAHPKKRPEPSE